MTVSIQTGKVDNFTASRDTGWYAVTFKNPFPEGIVPTVFTQVQTYNGADTPGVRLRKITNTGFEVIMNEIIMYGATATKDSVVTELGKVSSDGVHPHAETLAWMAIS